MKWNAIAIVLARLALSPAHVAAFSDPAAFADEVGNGGGGGRFFTGSPKDGYTCAVCHSGGRQPELSILGLPVAGYVPGTSYEVTITWPAESENVGLAVEITDGQGKAAGSIRLPPQAELLPPELCLPVTAGVPAATLTALADRNVVAVPDCGAQRLRMLWTAPASDAGPVWLYGSLVTSNAQGDVKGDGVTDFSRVLPSPSAPDPLATRIAAGCRVSSARHLDALGVPPVVLALAWLLLRGRRVRRRGLPARSR